METLKDIINIGTSNNNLCLFEGQYNLKNGMSYNSYIIKDEKTVILDTIDKDVRDFSFYFATYKYIWYNVQENKKL